MKKTICPALLLLVIYLISFYSCSSSASLARSESVQKTSAAADELLIAASELRKEINTKLETNPNSSSEDLILLVDKKIDEIETVKKEVETLATQRSFVSDQKKDFNKIRACQQRLGNISREVGAIHKSFKKELDKKLKSDVYFDTGSATISKVGSEELKRIITNDFNTLVTDWKSEEAYRNSPMKIKIRIIGYADLQGSSNVELRKSSNLAISQKRAESVKDIVERHLEVLKNKYPLQVEIDFEGKGEEAPPRLANPEQINNPERRVCYISGYVIPVF